MGCQLEPQGAALQQLQKSYASKGVFLCGINRIEHPYDVEDYLRHFGFTFPVVVDLNQESPSETFAPLGSIGILDKNRRRVRGSGGKIEFEPVDAEKLLSKLLPASPASATSTPKASVTQPALYQPPPSSRTAARPRIEAPGWSEPVRVGAGRYPRIISFGKDKDRALCLWVNGEMPQQRIEYTLWTGSEWRPACPLSTGPDGHAIAADVDANDKPVAVWSQKDPGEYRIYLGVFEETQWLEPIAVSPRGNDAFRPDVFCRASGEIAVAWYGWKRVKLIDYPNAWWRSIYVANVVDRQPGAPRELAELRRGSDDCWDPILTGSGPDLQVSWLRDENPPKLCGSVNGPAGWTRPEALLRLPALMAGVNRVQSLSPVRSAGRRSGLVFEMASLGQIPQPLTAQVHFMTFAANRWADSIPLSTGPGQHVAPKAVELANGKCVVFWCHLPGAGKPSTIRMREITGTRPAQDSVLISGDCSNSYPSAAADSTGTLWLAWQVEEESSSAIYVSRTKPK